MSVKTYIYIYVYKMIKEGIETIMKKYNFIKNCSGIIRKDPKN